MASRHQRRKAAKAKRLAMDEAFRQAFTSHARDKIVKANLSKDNRETATVTNHLGIARVVVTNAYQRIPGSIDLVARAGGLRQSMNMDRPLGDTDREVAALRKRLTLRVK